MRHEFEEHDNDDWHEATARPTTVSIHADGTDRVTDAKCIDRRSRRTEAFMAGFGRQACSIVLPPYSQIIDTYQVKDIYPIDIFEPVIPQGRT